MCLRQARGQRIGVEAAPFRVSEGTARPAFEIGHILPETLKPDRFREPMYIVNTTFIVEPAVHERWYDLFVRQFVPFLRAGGFGSDLTRMVFTRVLTDHGDPHYTYSLQVDVPDTAEYQRFMTEMIGEYASITGPLFGEQTLYFTSLLKKIVL